MTTEKIQKLFDSKCPLKVKNARMDSSQMYVKLDYY